MMEKLRWFFGEFHSGAVNQIAHFIGFLLLGFGLGAGRWEFVGVSGVFMMAGNLYNYARGRYRKEFWETLPLQIVSWAACVAGAFFAANALK
ncbi:MAG: hypothetical protein HY482_02185 [Candidatus Wildermuthbacteria bacterium]|nr:hypothetical protein [Candidatus Wildermuthbacteria bacterium]